MHQSSFHASFTLSPPPPTVWSYFMPTDDHINLFRCYSTASRNMRSWGMWEWVEIPPHAICTLHYAVCICKCSVCIKYTQLHKPKGRVWCQASSAQSLYTFLPTQNNVYTVRQFVLNQFLNEHFATAFLWLIIQNICQDS